MKIFIIVFSLLFITACSTTVTGPISKKKYNLDVGCTYDMQEYKKEREEVLGEAVKKDTKKKVKIECPTTE